MGTGPLSQLLLRIKALFRRKQLDRDLDDELQFHLAMREKKLKETGVPPDDAHYAARRTMGNSTRTKESSRDLWTFTSLESWWQDLRFAARMLRKNPGFTAVAVLTLALGIGANTAIFSLINTVMYRMLPVQNPQELVLLKSQTKNFGHGLRAYYTNPLWEALRDRQDVFSGVFAWGESEFNLASGGVAENIRGFYVSGDYFNALGVRAAAGRMLSVADDKRGCPGVAVLGYGFWDAHYGRATVVGSTIPIEGHPFQIIGVSAPGFFGTTVGSSFDVAVPMCSEAIINGKNSSLDNRSAWWLSIMGRPKAGMSTNQVAAGLAVLSPQIFAATVPKNWKPIDAKNYLEWKFVSVPAGTGISFLRSEYERPLQILMATAVLVLLIACANIASLMLARAATRRHEVGVRLAVGASRMRLVRQLLTECVLLSLGGAAVGILFAQWSSRLLVRYISTEHNKIFLDVALDGRVLGFTALAAILTGILFGVLPAFRSTRVSLASSVRGEAPGSGGKDARFRSGRWTVAVQIAICLVLVTTAGLLVRSFANLASLDAGFDRNNVLIVDANLHNTNLPNAQFSVMAAEILRRVRALPGVISASESAMTPVSHRTWDDDLIVDGPNAPKAGDTDVNMNSVTPEYFATLRSSLLRGRDFDEHDVAEAPNVIIVNETLAKKFFSGTDALGKTVRQHTTATELGAAIQIVGITRDSKYDSLREDFSPIAYFPLAQLPGPLENFSLEIRTAAAPAALAAAVTETVAGVNKSISLNVATFEQQLDDSLTQERLLATLSGFFGGLALLLALIGLYGVLAYLVLQRRQEIGIRMALGAQRGAILRLVVRDVAGLVLIGAVAGAAIAWGTTRFVQSLLFGLQADDPRTFAVGIGLLIVVAIVACYLPARRAMRVDPLVALRHE
jgi:putative ABC transport system permease protein